MDGRSQDRASALRATLTGLVLASFQPLPPITRFSRHELHAETKAPIFQIHMANSDVHNSPASEASPKVIPAARFKAECLRIIEQMGRDREPVTITRRGRPVAVLTPVSEERPCSIIGALKGAVLRYDDPFASAVAPEDWGAVG
jgi:prevent-host-death family protein